MSYEEFISSVEQKSGLKRLEAEEASHTFMDLISQRLTRDEVKDLAAQLPEELSYTLQEGAPSMRKFSVNEFFEQIAHSARIRQEDVLAVWETLKEAVSEGELEHVRTQLPKSFSVLLD